MKTEYCKPQHHKMIVNTRRQNKCWVDEENHKKTKLDYLSLGTKIEKSQNRTWKDEKIITKYPIGQHHWIK